MSILTMSIVVFINQLIFIGFRTWNVKAISNNNIILAMLSGGIVHLAWLVGIAIGAFSVTEIMMNFELKYIPVIISSLSGGLLGTWLAMKKRKKR